MTKETRVETTTKAESKLVTRVASMIAVALLAAGVQAATAAPPSAESEMLVLYDRMQTAMADDSSVGVEEAAKVLAAKSEAVGAKAKNPEPFKAVTDGARAVVAAADLEAEREAFRDLSLAMAKLVDSGELKGAGLFFCPMADAYWLQKTGDDELRNPYYGKSMLTCGSKVDKVKEN